MGSKVRPYTLTVIKGGEGGSTEGGCGRGKNYFFVSKAPRLRGNDFSIFSEYGSFCEEYSAHMVVGEKISEKRRLNTKKISSRSHGGGWGKKTKK